MPEEQNLMNESFKMDEVEGKAPSELLTLGIKAFSARNYKHAVQYLAKSSELLVEQHKEDTHDSLAEVHLFYGKTLLELSREEGDPLGDAVPKEVGMEAEESGDENDDENLEENSVEKKTDDKDSVDKVGKTDDEKAKDGKNDASVSESSEAAGKSLEKKKDKNKSDDASVSDSSEAAGKSLEKKKDKSKSDDASVTDKTDIKINGEVASSNSAKETVETGDQEDMEEDEVENDESGSDDAEDGGEGTTGEKAEEEEELTDLQLAWQVLELARLILGRRGDSGKAEYADCLITLGEISMENESFDCAITDIKLGLDIQQQLYKHDNSKQRRLAETFYKLGLAHYNNNQIEDGVKCYEECLALLKKRMATIEKSETEDDKKELAEIKSLIPEIEEKIIDMKNYKEETAKSLEAAREPAIVASPEKKATDISHLVKRKRKLEESTTSEEKPSKKPTP